jgi:hypothetical protein
MAEDPAPPSHSEGEGWTHVRDGDSVALRGKGRSCRMTPQSHRRAKIRRTSWTLRSLSGGSVRPKKKAPQVSRGGFPMAQSRWGLVRPLHVSPTVACLVLQGTLVLQIRHRCDTLSLGQALILPECGS